MAFLLFSFFSIYISRIEYAFWPYRKRESKYDQLKNWWRCNRRSTLSVLNRIANDYAVLLFSEIIYKHGRTLGLPKR